MATRFLDPFWKALDSGKISEPSQEELARMVDDLYFSTEPMTPLKPLEEKNLRKALTDFYHRCFFGADYLKTLTTGNFIYFNVSAEQLKKAKNIPNFRLNSNHFQICDHDFTFGQSYFVMPSDDVIKKRESEWDGEVIPTLLKLGGYIPNKEQRRKLFSDVNVWDEVRVIEYNGSTSTHRWGYRSLNEYGFSDKDFKSIVRRVKRQTGKTQLRMLDIGGGNGEACSDVEELCPEVKTINLTLNEEPAQYPGETMIASAERMPASLRGQCDIITSNMAFRYFLYPDLALENCLQALSVGGEAKLIVGLDRPPFETSDRNQRLIRQYARFKSLIDNGFIEIETRNPEVFTFKDEKGYFPQTYLQMKKLRDFK